MNQESFLEQIINYFGEKLYRKSLSFANNKINIIYLREIPIKINSIILDNDREFHLIINEKKKEIFHDCPSFLINTEREKKFCVHLVKMFLLIKKELSFEILNKFDDYILTSEDFGSKKKSKNFLLLANRCFENNSCIEGLSYLNKAIINQSECENIIEKYLVNAIENALYVEFFDFLKIGYENDLNEYFSKFRNFIEKGFKQFLKSISKFTFFSLLNVIESLNTIINFIDFTFLKDIVNDFKNLLFSIDFNEKYFSIYFIIKNIDILKKYNPLYESILDQNHVRASEIDILQYFLDEIDNLASIDKLKIMKNHFKVLKIPKEKYIEKYKLYKIEIRELERKVYLKKFSYLKLLMEKYNLNKAKGEFRKKRNTYIVRHDQENLRNPVYHYIISHLGFYGTENNIIKSNDIGVNYFFIRDLFSDDFHAYPDVFYYIKQFWGDINIEYEIKSIEAFKLISENISYSYNIDQKFSNINDVFIIEWDLANKPRQGSIVNAYGAQIIIPDQNNPLYHDLKPFDLCYCYKDPIKIEGNIKIVNVINKCSFKDAIKYISKNMNFIEGFYPLSLVKAVLNKQISPFKANELASNNPNKIFIPNYGYFIKDFRRFLFEFINKEKEYIFEELKSDPKEKSDQIILLLNLTNELAGIELPYSLIIEVLFTSNKNLKEFKLIFLNVIHEKIQEILEKRELGSTIIFDLNKMKNTQFAKYSNEINNLRKKEFENKTIYRIEDKEIGLYYDIREISDTFYGRSFLKILKIENKEKIKPDKFKKFIEFATKLNLILNINNLN